MEMVKIGNYHVTYQRQGNDRNGNPIFLVNVFHQYYPCGNNSEWVYGNYNYTISTQQKKRLDKYGNIRIQSYNIEDSINRIIKSL